MRNRTKVAAVLAGCIVLGTASAAIAAVTDNMFPTRSYQACVRGSDAGNGNVCQTDNGAVSWYMQSSVTQYSNDAAAIRATIDGSYDPISNLTYTYDSSPTYSGAGETDIIYQEGSISAGSNYVGYTWCDDPVDNSQYSCDQQYVRFKSSVSVDRALACHESGHAIGLLHGNEAIPIVDATDASILGCMRNPYASSAQYLGSNNVDNIHSTY